MTRSMTPNRRQAFHFYESLVLQYHRLRHTRVVSAGRRVVAMTDTVENLILDLVEWIGRKERTYQETMEAWRTSGPKLPVWEDATERGFVETTFCKWPFAGKSYASWL